MFDNFFIKVCGICRPEDALLAAQLGYSAVGLVFYPKSPRALDMATAQSILAAIKNHPIHKIALFMDAGEDEIIHTCQALPFTAIQFHGSESADFCQKISQQTGLAYIKSVPMGSLKTTAAVADYGCQFHSASALLMDANAQHQQGGSGAVFDWNLVRQQNVPVILAGGLTVENIDTALAIGSKTHGAMGVDVSSGVQQAGNPRAKCPHKMADFIAKIRHAGF